jgi:hypothetical protein
MRSYGRSLATPSRVGRRHATPPTALSHRRDEAKRSVSVQNESTPRLLSAVTHRSYDHSNRNFLIGAHAWNLHALALK